MSEDKNKKDHTSNGLMKMPPEKAATSKLADELATAAYIDRLTKDPGIPEGELHELRVEDYTVARNALDSALGLKDPYADKQIRERRASGELPPEPQD